MTQVNPIITTPEEQFVVGESDLAFFSGYACRIDGGAILFCRSGAAEVSVNQYQGHVCRNTLVLLLPGSILMLTDRTEDFRVTFCAFSRDLFAEAAFRLEPSFFHALRERPITSPPHRIVEGASIWFQMAAYTYRDRNNVFRNTIIKNRLQNLLLESFDKMQRFAARRPRTPETTTRQTELFHRFVTLVQAHSSQEREVSFYADKLCISTRYLSTIVRTVARSSAKEFIDRSVVLEIKMMLQSTDLSVQEIAYRLRFPDQSYLGRFFKKHTGESPTEYRNMRK
ncbi:AraC family transcriptional regulator [Alistipes timonensis]|uniref:AraC-type DNA-binding protein n=1 Tax=Alistipes timonensis JC136 TaxID=1033731 RepID=A0A1H3XJE6_9BACT|nr:helix-turn-helix domain-containing protein [Alistipes timonensis]MCR2030037.1 helix-turn-helix domain-containing protein [Alistipes timonensis]SDZ99537.1 AraC-type DNA-binding protein [Alistipes timonensis JC136]